MGRSSHSPENRLRSLQPPSDSHSFTLAGAQMMYSATGVATDCTISGHRRTRVFEFPGAYATLSGDEPHHRIYESASIQAHVTSNLAGYFDSAEFSDHYAIRIFHCYHVPCLLVGIPPRVRGEPLLIQGAVLDHGHTPASAGRTRRVASVIALYRAYPRECGENLQSRNSHIWGSGIPPRVRGEPLGAHHRDAVDGHTPASAGRTSVRADSWSMSSGIPPRVRGEQVVAHYLADDGGHTPASAGRTVHAARFHHERQAYPRECGENSSCSKMSPAWVGIPPRVRGEPIGYLHSFVFGGHTPASAGRTQHTGS